MVFFHAHSNTPRNRIFKSFFFLLPFFASLCIWFYCCLLYAFAAVIVVSFFTKYRCHCKFTWRSERKMPLENEMSEMVWNFKACGSRGSWLLKLISLLFLKQSRKKNAACQIRFFYSIRFLFFYCSEIIECVSGVFEKKNIDIPSAAILSLIFLVCNTSVSVVNFQIWYRWRLDFIHMRFFFLVFNVVFFSISFFSPIVFVFFSRWLLSVRIFFCVYVYAAHWMVWIFVVCRMARHLKSNLKAVSEAVKW